MTARRWLENAMWPVVVGLMVGCIVLSVVSLMELFFADWDGTYLVVFCGLTVVEAWFAFRLYQRNQLFLTGGFRFRLLELGILFMALQLYGDVVDGQAPLQDGVPHFDGKTLGLFVLVFFAWWVTTSTARDLHRIGEPPDRSLGRMPAEADRPPAHRLAGRFFWGGVLLFAAAALTQVHIAQALKMPTPATSGPVLNVLLYFLLGMLMLGQVRLLTLRSRWRHQEIAVTAGLGSRWLRYSLAFVGLVLIVALLLPTSRTMGLIDVGRAMWGPVSELSARLVTMIGRLLLHLGVTFHPRAPIKHVQPPPLPPLKHLPSGPPVHRKSHPSHGGHWGAIAQSLIFWAAVLAGGLYLIRSYLRGRPGVRRVTARLAAMLGALLQVWHALRHWLRDRLKIIRIHLPRPPMLRPGRPAPPNGVLRFVHPGGLSARERIQRYYLNIVGHAERRGVPRALSQTPHEFTETLAPRVPEAEGDLDLLTGAFVEARYSRHKIGEAQVVRARQSWQRVRAALRRSR